MYPCSRWAEIVETAQRADKTRLVPWVSSPPEIPRHLSSSLICTCERQPPVPAHPTNVLSTGVACPRMDIPDVCSQGEIIMSGLLIRQEHRAREASVRHFAHPTSPCSQGTINARNLEERQRQRTQMAALRVAWGHEEVKLLMGCVQNATLTRILSHAISPSVTAL